MRHSDLTLIGTVAGVRFYEDPEHGDEAPLMAYFERSFRETELWELPDEWEVMEYIYAQDAYIEIT